MNFLAKLNRKSFSTISWLLVSICMVLGVSFYAYKIMVQDYAQVTINYEGRAYAATVQLAMGLTPFMEQYKRYELPKEVIRKCAVKDSGAGMPCLLIYAHSSEFYKNCAWWSFESCVHIAADPVILIQPSLLAQLQTIIKAPCSYLPPVADIEAEAVSDTQKSVAIRDYLSHREVLGCNSKEFKKTKVHLQLGAGESLRNIIIVSNNRSTQ